ncbi:unnamed protein product [Orchesella dallaii]|uniref:Peptidase S1 domain-containing protein n=1 Tax=Orchesella dallaii TaxID=48710 RepID=A0ABP1QFL9_9HEXA
MKVKIAIFAILSYCAASQVTNNLNDSSVSNSTSNFTSGNVELFIVGGVATTPNEFPWLVNLRINGGLCGGSLISMDTVLTAAHCVHGASASSITVIAGDYDRLINESTEQISSAKGVKWHERYNNLTLVNDIALIKLSRNLTLTRAVSPIPLPASNFPANVTGNGTVAGWGTTSSGGTSTNRYVLKVTVPIVSNQICSRSYTGLTDSQLCAGETGKDSCQGDSGGPFICNGATPVFCGIVSYGRGCGAATFPGVYTKVSSFVPWINVNKDFTSSTSSGSSLLLSFSLLLFTITFFFLRKLNLS